MSVSIYALLDPSNSHARYVGKTSRPLRTRWDGHMRIESSSPASKWVVGLKNSGRAPMIIELESGVDADKSTDAESFWIEYLSFLGSDLTNVMHNKQAVRKERVYDLNAKN
jgi:hypothetical protein